MTTYLIYILAAVIITAGGVMIYKRQQLATWLNKEENQRLIKKLIKAAEAQIVGTKLGQERLYWVIGQIIKILPEAMQKTVNIDLMIQVINLIFEQIATRQSDGSLKAI